MKVTFELPAPVGEQLRAHVPRGKRSRFVAEAIAWQLKKRSSALTEAARRANRLSRVTAEMKGWEALNGGEE